MLCMMVAARHQKHDQPRESDLPTPAQPGTQSRAQHRSLAETGRCSLGCGLHGNGPRWLSYGSGARAARQVLTPQGAIHPA